jgi:hypothetical protein
VDLTGRFPVLIQTALNSGRGKLLNLSEGGAFVATPMLILPQAQVQIRVALPEKGKWIDAEGVVTWENRGARKRNGYPQGYGFRFTKISDESREALVDLLAKRGSGSEGAEAPPKPIPGAEPSPVDESEIPPYRLITQNLARVPSQGQGVFVLYYDRTQEAQVRRADADPRAMLEDFVGTYSYFWYEELDNVEDGYRRECQLFHYYGGDRGQLDSAEHPVPPSGVERADCWECGVTPAPGPAA